jgi:leucyl-tRNA synthetase
VRGFLLFQTGGSGDDEGDMSSIGAIPGGSQDDGQPPFRYNARLAAQIESRWQDRWAADGTFDSPNPAGPLAAGFAERATAGRGKFYILDMFPYPSGTGLHVGHPLGYISTDVYARYLRMTGHHVLHTFGYDAFGLPAEQYAIDTGQHPRVTTRANIDTMRRQLRRLGLGHDTRREISTTDPGYYRWTQWIFLKIFNSWRDERTGRARPIADLVAEFAAGQRAAPGGRPWGELTAAERRAAVDARRLAYLSEELVNWCPALGTVLANEEVTADGRSDVGNYPVYRRPLRQWMLRITAFADRLADDLDGVDWPEPIRQMQRNWIGASDGALITLPPAGPHQVPVEVFTTRPDTLAGATYVALAPEHPDADRIVPDTWPPDTPAAWIPPQFLNSEPRPTPAQSVTAFRVAARRRARRGAGTVRDGGGAVRDGAGEAGGGLFTGAFVTNPATGQPIPVFLADYVLMGYGTGAIMAVPAHDERDREFAERYGLPVRPVPESAVPEPEQGGIDAAIDWLERGGYGRRARSYRLRDWLFSRQRYWGEPFPIVYDAHGPVPLPEQALPVRLPEMTDFRPAPAQDEASDPVPPLARAAGWSDVELDLGDGPRTYRRELNTMPQWAGSCWYYLRYLDPANEQAFVDPRVERYWMVPPDATRDGEGGVDLYVGGVEHAVLHLLYARFWHKVLYDLGHVSTSEPFRRLRNQGYILADAFTDERGMYVPAQEVTRAGDGAPSYRGRPVTRRSGKMGKSLKNGVSPDEIYDQYGADTLRLYEMAMGPLDTDRPWRTGDIVGVHRFLQRLWRSLVDEQTGQARVSDRPPGAVPLGAAPPGAVPPGDPLLRRLHQTIVVVRRDFEELRFNTAIARLTELVTHAAQVTARDGALPRDVAQSLVLMVAPLAPHIAEELWSRLGHEESLAYTPFPQADADLAAERAVTLPVQVNGKTRFTVEVPATAGQAEIERLVTGHPDTARHTAGLTIQRVVIVPGRIANIVAR